MHTIFILSAPSGCGKSSLVRALLQDNAELKVSISHTTRAKREYETEGIDYFFIDKNTFDAMVANDEFIEYAQVFDNYYGTSQTALEQILNTHNAIIEIDWQGARQIRKLFDNVVSIFILPPSVEELQKRLETRGDDSALIARRMTDAHSEISHQDEYDYQVVNDDFNTALTEIKHIINEQTKRTRNT